MSEITCTDRVTFTPTGAVGTVLERFERTGLGDLSGEWATVRFDDGETIAVRCVDLDHLTADVAHARYLGADAALTSSIDHCTMSAHEARTYLSPEADDRLSPYPPPELGEWEAACGETLGMQLDLDRWTDGIGAAWEEGRDAVWGDALQATALRVLGEIDNALRVEQANEAIVASYRKAAGL